MSKKIIKELNVKAIDSFKTVQTSVCHYAIIDKNKKYFMQNWYADADYAKQITLFSFYDPAINNPSHGSYRPLGYSLDLMENIMTILKNVAPIDIKVHLNNVEERDDAKKDEIIKNLDIYETKIETISSFRRMTPSMTATAKQIATIGTNLQRSISSGKLAMLSSSKINRIQEVLREIG